MKACVNLSESQSTLNGETMFSSSRNNFRQANILCQTSLDELFHHLLYVRISITRLISDLSHYSLLNAGAHVPTEPVNFKFIRLPVKNQPCCHVFKVKIKKHNDFKGIFI